MALDFDDPGPVPAAPEPAELARDDAAAAALGRAVHRVLEWAAPMTADIDVAQWAVAAAAEFGATAADVEQVASAILGHAETARFFRGPQIGWSGDEVAVSYGGELLRIDRLVRIDEGEARAWWVLDYKLRHAPEQLESYRRQLLRYRDAVAAAEPGVAVRCAFVTGRGRVVEIT